MKKILLSLMPVMLILLLACAQRSAPPVKPETAGTESQKSQPAAREPWEDRWEKTVTEAKKEGKVIIYTGIGALERQALSDGFRKKFGIQTEWVAGRGSELFQKVNTEYRAGIYLVDLYFSGTTTMLTQMKPAGILSPLAPVLFLPEVTNPSLWYENKLPWLDKEQYIITFQAAPGQSIFFNTKLARLDEVDSFKKLLNPRWKGKILMNDPTVAGNGNFIFSTSVAFFTGESYWREFARNQAPVIMRDQRLLVEWVALGKYVVSLGGSSGPDEEFINAGAPLERANPSEGSALTTGFGAIVLVNKSPHPNAASIFVNWLLSKEGQTIYAEASGRQSARTDVPVDNIPPTARRLPGVNYVNSETEEFRLKGPEYMRLAQEIFGPLMR